MHLQQKLGCRIMFFFI